MEIKLPNVKLKNRTFSPPKTDDEDKAAEKLERELNNIAFEGQRLRARNDPWAGKFESKFKT